MTKSFQQFLDTPSSDTDHDINKAFAWVHREYGSLGAFFEAQDKYRRAEDKKKAKEQREEIAAIERGEA